ncbi:MAG: hypothetical protein CL773_05760 [Chloroflexi bacterium]|nr:hypothetical protein [Chloroflexota bacterium]
MIFAQGEGYSRYKIFHQEEISNYNVEISISPTNPVVGQQIFSIYISDIYSKKPVEDLVVNVYATPLFDDKKKTAPALSSPSMKGYYQAIFRMEKAGNWIMDFEIDDGVILNNITEQIEIFERNRTLNSGDFSYGFIAMQVIFIGGLSYVIYAARRRRRKLNS